MGNVPIPFHSLIGRLNTWTLEKKLLIWKIISLAACIVGSGVYMSPLEPYLEAPFFGILVPTFIIGYIIIHSSDVFILAMKEEYIFLELCLSAIGVVGSLACGIYQLQKWIEWIVDTSRDPNEDYGIPDLVLALAFIFHSISLIAVMVHRMLQHYKSSNENQ